MGGQVTTMIERSRGEGRGVRRTTTAVRRTEGDLLLLLIAWTITVTPLDPAVALPPLETADTSTTVTWAKAITGATLRTPGQGTPTGRQGIEAEIGTGTMTAMRRGTRGTTTTTANATTAEGAAHHLLREDAAGQKRAEENILVIRRKARAPPRGVPAPIHRQPAPHQHWTEMGI